MATKKAVSTKKSAAKDSASQPQAAPTVKAASTTSATKTVVHKRREPVLPSNLLNIIFAELLGTFMLTIAAIGAATQFAPLYLGLTLLVIAVAVGAVSGAHINPAVTFGLWTMRKLKTALVPFYWIAQLLGGALAVVVLNGLSGSAFKLSFEHFTTFSWAVFGVELVGAAVLMFGIAAAVSRVAELKQTGQAVGIGLSLTAAAIVAGGLLTQVQASVDTSSVQDIKQLPHELRAKSATLNPAVAIAATEAPDSSFTGAQASRGETGYSRLSLEVIAGTLIGAALGGNLYLLVAGRKAES